MLAITVARSREHGSRSTAQAAADTFGPVRPTGSLCAGKALHASRGCLPAGILALWLAVCHVKLQSWGRGSPACAAVAVCTQDEAVKPMQAALM